jgi:hypothetical protein
MKQSPRLMCLRQQVVVLLDGHRDNMVRLLLVAMNGTPFFGRGGPPYSGAKGYTRAITKVRRLAILTREISPLKTPHITIEYPDISQRFSGLARQRLLSSYLLYSYSSTHSSLL